MKLYNYLNENKLYNDDIYLLKQTLHEKCSYFLNECNGYWLLRGVSGSHMWGIRTIRDNRKPKDNTLQLHNIFDKTFYDMFGWRARSNSVFCTGSISVTNDYGEPYLIFPIGKYNFIYSKHIQDLYLSLIKPKGKVLDIINYYKIFDYENVNQFNWIDIFDKSFRKKNNIDDKVVIDLTKDICSLYKKNVKITEAINSYNEIMMNCKEYVEIERDYFQENKQYLGLL